MTKLCTACRQYRESEYDCHCSARSTVAITCTIILRYTTFQFFYAECVRNKSHYCHYLPLAGVPVEGKSSVCLICVKYRIIILIIIIISLGQILLSYIANTSRTPTCKRERMHARTYTRAHTDRRRRRTGYRYSLAPNHDRPLRW